MRRFTIVTGLPASGKTTICDLLGRNAGVRVFNLGDLVWATVRAQGLKPQSRLHAGELFMAHWSAEYLGKLTLEAASHQQHAVLDGLRLPGTLRFLRASAEVRLVAVVAPEEERVRRLTLLGKVATPSIFDHCIRDLIYEADISVDNGVHVESPTASFAAARRFMQEVMLQCSPSSNVLLPPWVKSTPAPTTNSVP